MNRYPLWKYAMLVVALLVGLLYTLPNFFGEAPAVQVSSSKATVRISQDTVKRVQQALADAKLQADFVQLEGNSVKARFKDGDSQLKAKDVVSKALNPIPATPPMWSR
jgi:preprotein translocase subunit SecD